MPNLGIVYPAYFMPSNDLANATAETLYSNSQGQLAKCTVPSDGQMDRSRVKLYVAGRVSTTSNLNFTLAVYFGTGSTIAGNTQIYTTNAVTINNRKTNFHVDLDLFWDSDSNTVCGTVFGQMGNGILGPTQLVNAPSAIPNLHNVAPGSSLTYAFTVTGLFSGSSTGNHSFLDVLSLELK